MTKQSENINYFEIEEPSNYICKIHSYGSRDNVLTLEAWKSGDRGSKFHIIFADIIYFNGVTSWKGGVNFQLGTIEEMISTLKSLEKNIDFSDYKLYIVNADDATVRIIAKNANIDTNPPQ